MSAPEPTIHSIAGVTGVIISAREIYDAVVRLTGRVDVVIDQASEIKSDVKDHEMRLRALEANRWPVPLLNVILALITIGISVAALGLTLLLSK